MKIKTLFIIILAAVLGMGVFAQQSTRQSGRQGHKDVWYCPMHPQYTSDRPGKCPICGMDLVKQEVGPESPQEKNLPASDNIPDYIPVSLSLKQQQLIALHTAVVSQKIVIPRDAVMDTGLRKIVFVQKAPGEFEPRIIHTGRGTGDDIEVRSGLKTGERIVVSGNFLLDSESRLQASLEGNSNG